MAGDSSFDIVSKVDRQEVDNALNQAAKELSQRFDFKNTGAAISWHGEEGVEITANAEERALAALDVFKDKLVRRGVSLKALDAGEPRQSGREVKIDASINQGISQEQAKKVGEADPRRGPQGRQGPDPGRRAAGVEQEARPPAGRDRPGQGAGLRLRRAVRQLPLNAAARTDGRAWRRTWRGQGLQVALALADEPARLVQRRAATGGRPRQRVGRSWFGCRNESGGCRVPEADRHEHDIGVDAQQRHAEQPGQHVGLDADPLREPAFGIRRRREQPAGRQSQLALPPPSRRTRRAVPTPSAPAPPIGHIAHVQLSCPARSPHRRGPRS